MVGRKLTDCEQAGDCTFSRHRAKIPGPCAADFNFNFGLENGFQKERRRSRQQAFEGVVGREKAERV